MSKVFCPAPFVHFYHKGGPFGKICCIAKGKIVHADTSEKTWATNSYVKVRKDILEDTPVKYCTPCYDEEKLGGYNRRR